MSSRTLWLRFLLWRLVGAVVTLLTVAIGVFAVTRLGPEWDSFGSGVDPASTDREGLAEYLWHLLQGDLGHWWNGAPLTRFLLTRALSTLELAGVAAAIAVAVGLALGLAARRSSHGRRRSVDRVFSAAAGVVGVLPELVTATALAWIFNGQLRLLPLERDGGGLSLVLPSIAVALVPTFLIARAVRAGRTRPVADVLAVGSAVVGTLLAGTVIVEQVLSRNGLGSAFVVWAYRRDWPLVEGSTVLFALLVVVAYTAIAIGRALADPRLLSPTLGRWSPSAPAVQALRIGSIGIPGLVLFAGIVFLVAFGPVIWGDHAEVQDLARPYENPSWAHLLGTDSLGRDYLDRTLAGTRLSVLVGLGAAALGIVVGAAASAAAFVLGGPAARWLLQGIDAAVAFPAIVIAIVFAAIQLNAILAVGLAVAPSFAWATSALVNTLEEQETARGSARARFLLRRTAPIADDLIAAATACFVSALFAVAMLSYLGLGVRAPDFDWGRLLTEGVQAVHLTPAAFVAPSLALILAALAVSSAGATLGSRLAKKNAPES